MTSSLKKALLFILSIMIANISNASVTLTLTGPELTEDLIGYNNTGLEFTVNEDLDGSITLDGFIFQNQGKQDTLTLIDDSTGETLQTYSYDRNYDDNNDPIDNSPQIINLNWELDAGKTYLLLSEDQSNGRWTSYSAFPVLNDHIQISKSHSDVLNGNLFWLNFNNLTTTFTAPIPLPAAIWFFGTGVLTLFGFKSHRKLF